VLFLLVEEILHLSGGVLHVGVLGNINVWAVACFVPARVESFLLPLFLLSAFLFLLFSHLQSNVFGNGIEINVKSKPCNGVSQEVDIDFHGWLQMMLLDFQVFSCFQLLSFATLIT
jgi:hypothetical protein